MRLLDKANPTATRQSVIRWAIGGAIYALVMTFLSLRLVSTLLIGEVMRPRQAFLRFSVRGLIVLVLLAAIGLGSLARAERSHPT
jgi:hypothetical protein